MFLSPLLRRKFNLTRIQSLLDAFQSCYDDKFRWYSGVYLLSWIILNINMPYYVTEIILVAVGTLHFMIQPYKYRWLNIVDTLLLVDLNMLAFLTSVDSPNSIHKETVPISYVLVVLPLTCITIGGVWIISVINIKWCKSKILAVCAILCTLNAYLSLFCLCIKIDIDKINLKKKKKLPTSNLDCNY